MSDGMAEPNAPTVPMADRRVFLPWRDSSVRPRAFLVALAVPALLRIFLTAGVPTIYRSEFRVDDMFYVRAADFMLSGQWLGPYDDHALVKRIGFPAFLAAAHALAVPRRLAEDGLLAGAALVLVWALRRLGISQPTALAAYLCCLFSPATFSALVLPRVLRENIYLAQTILVLALAIALVPRAPLRSRGGIAVVLGLVLAWYWQTREESEWILPSLGILLGTVMWNEWRGTRSLRSVLTVAALLVAIPGALTWSVDHWIRSTNARIYGAPITVETQDPDFEAAVSAFARIAQHDWQRWEPVTGPVRERLYAVSPAFRSLRPVVESHAYKEPVMLAAGGERTFWYFFWVLRDAAAIAGYHQALPKAKAFYRQLADEINAACDSGVVAAGPRRATPAPRLHPSLYPELGRKWLGGIADMWRFNFGTVAFIPPWDRSTAGPADSALFQRILTEPSTPTRAAWQPWKMSLVWRIQIFFQTWLRWIVLAGALGLVVQLLTIRRGDPGLLGVQLALIATLAVRTTLYAVIDTYCWMTYVRYLLCVYPLLPVGSLIAAEAGARRIAGVLRHRVRQPSEVAPVAIGGLAGR